MRQFLLIFGILFALASLGAQDIWTEDWEAALQRAQRENKDLLINFTGSDWCGWCQRLSAEVFDTPEFRSQAPRNYILVKLDFPRSRPQTPQVQTRNRGLANRYGVEGYPTIFLADSQGRPYARMGYQAGGPAKYLRDMDNHRSRKDTVWDLLRRADRETGLARARLLDEFYTQAENLGSADFFVEVIDQIVALDTRNEAGLREKYSIKKELETLKRSLDERSNWTEVLRRLKTLEDRAQQARQVVLQQDVLVVQAAINMNALDNKSEARSLLERVRQLDPRSRWGQLAADVLPRLR